MSGFVVYQVGQWKGLRFGFAGLLFILAACTPTVTQLEPYSGPKARLAVAMFACETNCGPREGTGLEYSNRALPALSTGLAEDLAERLEASRRFSVLGPAALGFVNGYRRDLNTAESDLLLLATILEVDTTKTRQGEVVAGLALSAQAQTAYAKVRFEVYDLNTHQVVFTKELEARSANLGGQAGSRRLQQSLDFFRDTPLLAALEEVMQEALYSLAQGIPEAYFVY